MLPVIATNCVAMWMMTSLWLMTSHGYVVMDEETEGDDMWPVLCPPNTFYSKIQDECLACSQCPANKVIVTECHGLHDTKCSPLYNFEDSNSPAESLPMNETYNNHKNKDLASHRTKPRPEGPHQEGPTGPFEFTDSEWKFVTICLFVFLSLAAIIIFIVVIYLFRQKDAKEKNILCEYSLPVDDV